ncbi:MAG: OmpA family protein [Bacteroidia bacterium]|nr:OmpA family protein [Bacteroidia bacterium]MDW8159163.1 OmpA family protein [Bacteroidia bacterium]
MASLFFTTPVLVSIILAGCNTTQKAAYKAGEPLCVKDSIPPDYKPLFFSSRKTLTNPTLISEASQITRTEVDSQKIQIYFHLLDSAGVLYAGATTPSNRAIWCGVTVEYDKYKKNIKQYSLKEFSFNPKTPLAFAIILDHSGSMGHKRAKILQQATDNFLKEIKKSHDAVSIIKFDHRVEQEVPLLKPYAEIKKRFRMNGLGKFGFKTALRDALLVGINDMIKASGFYKKSVILLTDGMDNASKTSLDTTLYLATTHKIPINVIGFGHYIAADTLQTIATQTGGSFYHIYSSKDFLAAFNDIYQKYSNGYLLEIKPEYWGIQKIIIKLCLPNKKIIELKTVIDNSRPDWKPDSITIAQAYSENPISSTKASIPKTNPTDTVSANEEPQVGQILLLDVYFDHDKATLKPESETALQKAFDLLTRYPTLTIELRGHTDSVGSHRHNKQLSLRRAEAVKKALVRRGIEPHRLTTVGFGEDFPIAPNSTPQGRAINRRTEIRITGK